MQGRLLLPLLSYALELVLCIVPFFLISLVVMPQMMSILMESVTGSYR